jgi:hypothetical protein
MLLAPRFDPKAHDIECRHVLPPGDAGRKFALIFGHAQAALKLPSRSPDGAFS